jgi:hypothetical protein
MNNRSESRRATSLQIISSTDFPQCFWIAIQVGLTQDARLPPGISGLCGYMLVRVKDALAQALENSTSWLLASR